MKKVFTIAKKEFNQLLNSSLAYVIAVPFLFISIFLYLRAALAVGEANLRSYFELYPWFLLIVAPALSMKVLTEEYKSNTLELLFAHPLKEIEIILGKYLGALGFFIVLLLATLGLPFTLIIFSHPDLGQIIGQYFGGFLIGATFIAIGIAASSLVKNAISAFLLAASINFIFLIIGIDFVTLLLPSFLSRIASEASLLVHTQNLAKGLIDLRDIFYFFTLTALFLLIAVIKLSERKTVEDIKEKAKLNLAIGLLIGIGVISNILLSTYPLRIDLTSSKIFTLSPGTKITLKNLPDIVNITLYTSPNLPGQMQINYRAVSDLLKNYQRLSKNVKVKEVYPETDLQILNEATNIGIQEVTFNRISAGKFEAQKGYLGLAIRYGDKKEVIPFIAEVSDLEYQITRRIRKLTAEKEKTIGLLKNGFYIQDQILTKLLQTEYKIERIGEGDINKINNFSALIVIDDGSRESTASALIKNYLSSEGKVLYLGGGVNISPQSLSAQKSNSKISEFLKDYGVTVNNDLVYDLQLNEIISFGDGNTRYFMPYPFWIKAVPGEEKFLPLISVKSVTLGWPSSLKIEKKEGYNYKILLTTSLNSGKLEESFNIAPETVKNLQVSQKEKIPLAIEIEKDNLKIAVVTSGTVIEDQFLNNNQDNVSFISNMVDYLAADKEAALIPSRSLGRSVFEFKSPLQVVFAQWGNLLIPPLLVVGFAIWHLRKRKILAQRSL